MQNILVASTRQYRPQEEWILLGTRYLIEKIWTDEYNWVLYDKNPDLLAFDGVRTSHRRILQSNSFRHQTLLPFSAVVIAGGTQWSGGSMEVLYGLLHKTRKPFFVMGIELSKALPSLSDVEIACLARHDSVVCAKNESTKHFLERHAIDSTLLPCPSLFAGDFLNLKSEVPQNVTPKIGFLVEQPKGEPEFPLRSLLKEISQLSKTYDMELICPTVDDFMQLSTMFGGKVRYAYESREYFSLIQSMDIIVTTSLTAATVANSLGRPAVLTRYHYDRDEENLVHLPHTQLAKLGEIELQIKKVSSPLLPMSQVLAWKNEMQTKWFTLLQNKETSRRVA